MLKPDQKVDILFTYQTLVTKALLCETISPVNEGAGSLAEHVDLGSLLLRDGLWLERMLRLWARELTLLLILPGL